MINPKATKGFIFAFLCIIAGGFVCVAGGSATQIGLIGVGLAFMAFGLFVGLFSLSQ